MDSSVQTGEKSQDSQKFLKNIGNKLADEEDGSIKSGSINKELEGLTKINVGEKYFILYNSIL
jgi:hypothetical protein